MFGAEVRFDSEAFLPISRELEKFSPRSVIEPLAALLTVPEYQKHAVRMEVLLHLACLHSRGDRQARGRDLRRWLGRYLVECGISSLEDPPEDVFISNVVGRGGNYRLFEGTWESADYGLQQALDCFIRTAWGGTYKEALRSAHALLALSDVVAERADLHRWEAPNQLTADDGFPPRHVLAHELRGRVRFGLHELANLGAPFAYLGPFLLQPSARSMIRQEVLGHTTFERHPVIRFGDELVLACPSAVSPAIRRFLMETAEKKGQLDEFTALLRQRGLRTLVGELLPQLCPETSAEELPEPDVGQTAAVPVDVVVAPMDNDKIALVVHLHDDLQELSRRGLGAFPALESSCGELLERHCEAWKREGYGGLAVVVWSGLGGGRAVALPHLPGGWHSVAIGMADLDMYARTEEASLLRLWKLSEQEHLVSEGGVQIIGFPTLLNLYGFWEQQGFRLIPPEVPFPGENGSIYLPPDYVNPVRIRERRSLDRHASKIERRSYVVVERHHRRTFFDSLENRPIYTAPDLARRQELAAVVERKDFAAWVVAKRPEDASAEVAGFLFHIWQALIEWIDRASDALLELYAMPSPLTIRLSIPDLARWRDFSTSAGNDPPDRPRVSLLRNHHEVSVEIPFGFLTLVRRPTNDGERALLEDVLCGVISLLPEAEAAAASNATEIVDKVLGGPDRRSLHLFNAQRPTDHLGIPGTRAPSLIPPEDVGTWTMGLAYRSSTITGPGVIHGKEPAVRALNELVDAVWRALADRLKNLDAASVVEVALANNEAIFRDREHWRRTARAVIALYDESADVAGVASAREADRAEAALAGRVLVEMASVTSSREGGEPISRAGFDHLRAGVALLVGLASDSDAIHGSVAEPRIEIAPNGTVGRDHAFLAEVGKPYVTRSFGRTYRTAAQEYERYFDDDSGEAGEDNPYHDPQFRAAFHAEYGIEPDVVFDAAGELFDMAGESGSAVLRTTRGDLVRRLQDNRGFDAGDAAAVLGCLALVDRPRWDTAPKGFVNRDWYPWAYRRRLALSVRPVVVLGDDDKATVLVGMYQLGASITYLLEGIRDGWFPIDSFHSAEMRQYWGDVVRRRGQQFTQDVAEVLSGLGWQTKTEVEGPAIGAPQRLGDFDVLAWREADDRILAIECKSLQPARTIGEIVELLNQFRGEAGDRLHKHMRRLSWLESNLPLAKQALGIPDASIDTVGLLVTNSEVPMQFRRNLPLDPEYIVPIFDLKQLLS